MLTLRNKDDIIVPFHTLGEPDWEKNTRMLLEAYAEELGVRVPDPLPAQALEAVENRLGISFPESLALFYRTFGIADIGEELQALENIAPLEEWAEHFEWEEWANEEERDIARHLVTFSEYVGNGNAFCFHRETGEVYYFDHDTAPYVTKLFDRPDEYLKGCLVALQEHFFTTDAAADIVEDKLVEMFGERVVTKWMY
jgi:SMI1 / KNR4 family.